ncbi:MAG: aconitate hydratase [Gammaproteobacteria bacterium]|nr:aconitate hydratase [Gammaproteobacteria bacterium]
MQKNVAQKIIDLHRSTQSKNGNSSGELYLKIDQTLAQDATGTVVMLEFEALEIPRVKTEVSVQYVDHNLLQTDFKNADDHVFLRSACRKFGVWYSPPGNGVSHPVHMQYFGIPGKTLLGSDSHTCAGGALGMLAIGAGGLEVALAMAGEPFSLPVPKILGVRLVGQLPQWVSAKDVILEMLRRHTVSGGVGKIIEYYGPGLKHCSLWDRHVIANMGAELGATASLFPSDDVARRFLKQQKREQDWIPLIADKNAKYDEYEEIDLSKLEPLIACPSSPDKVVPVREIAGQKIYQAYIGSSANPGLRDFGIAAHIVDGKHVHDSVSFDINPGSRQVLEDMISMGILAKLVHAGARLHQVGCNGCIGMGQAPATNQRSLRTVPRNFPGRSGTLEDSVYLCSPEVAAASALKGVITDPRTLGIPYSFWKEPKKVSANRETVFSPQPIHEAKKNVLEKGPNIKPLPDFKPIAENFNGKVLLKLKSNISTDEILPAGERVLPFRSNIPVISEYVFIQVDDTFYERARLHQKEGFFIVAGENYGQGSSREHAAMAPRFLGLKAVIAKSFARIHRQNLINFGILPLTFIDPKKWNDLHTEDILQVKNVRTLIQKGKRLTLYNVTTGKKIEVEHGLSLRQINIMLAGGLINWMKGVMDKM